MFLNLFRKKVKLPPVDLSILKTDIHCHLLPGIDDGTKTIEESVALIKNMKELGYEKIIITPHIQNDYFKNTPDIINAELAKLNQAVKENNIDIVVEAAAEYLIDDGFQEKAHEGTLMTFGDKYLLIELSYYNMYSQFYQQIFDLNIKDYKIILAHPERYAYFHENLEIYEDLKARGVFFQLNIISLSGHYSERVKKVAEKLIDMNLYDFAASDLHNFDYYNNFVKSLSNKHLHKLIDSGYLKNHLI